MKNYWHDNYIFKANNKLWQSLRYKLRQPKKVLIKLV